MWIFISDLVLPSVVDQLKKARLPKANKSSPSETESVSKPTMNISFTSNTFTLPLGSCWEAWVALDLHGCSGLLWGGALASIKFFHQ